MAADNEHRLLCKAIAERDVVTLLKAGVKDTWFFDDDNRAVWRFLVKHHTTYGECPTGVTVKDNYPNFRLLRVEDSLEYLLDTITNFVRYKRITDGLTDAIEVMTETRDTDAIMNTLAATIAEVNAEGVPGTNEVDLTVNPMERFTAYKALKDHGGMLGLPTGFTKIDEATAGLQAGQLITVIAPPKTGKSQLCMAIAINLHRAGQKVMFQSFEMSNREQQERHDALRAKVSHGRLRRGILKDYEERNYVQMLKEMDGLIPFHLTDAVKGMTVSSLSALIDNAKPDVVIVDGVYLMIDEQTGESNTPAALTNITRALKRLAQRAEIPIIISTQTLLWKMKGGKVTADSIGYCVDEDTEILTKDGWRTQDQIHPGDVVLTLNHDTGMSEWQAMSAVNRFPAMPRDLILMEGQSHSSLSTAQHRWPVLHHWLRREEVTREWSTTGSLNSCDYIITAAESSDVPDDQTYSTAFVEAVAWFWTEGHLNGRYGNVGIAQSHTKNPGYVSMIRRALTAWLGTPLPQDGNLAPRDGSPYWRENRRDPKGLTEFWLNAVAGRRLLEVAPGKVPTRKFLLNLTRDQLHRFIEVSMFADNNGSSALSQKNKESAEMFQFALTLAGINSSLSQSKDGMWRVGFRARQVVTPVAAARQGSKFKIEIVRHDGMIWCPTTPNGTWMARRKGNVYFTGNSSSFFQDSDVILGLEGVEDDEEARTLKIVESRNCGPQEVPLVWRWDVGCFHEVEVMDECLTCRGAWG